MTRGRAARQSGMYIVHQPGETRPSGAYCSPPVIRSTHCLQQLRANGDDTGEQKLELDVETASYTCHNDAPALIPVSLCPQCKSIQHEPTLPPECMSSLWRDRS
jgi:hypothetical protein